MNDGSTLRKILGSKTIDQKITIALAQAGGSREDAAKLLGISRRTLGRLIAERKEMIKYVYRWKRYRPELYGRACRVLKRGKMNSCSAEFENGEKCIVSRNSLRREWPK